MGCNHAVSLNAFFKVNGYNENIEDTGCEDDDFVRRLYKIGVKPKIAVNKNLAYHLYHKPRSRDDEKSKKAWETLADMKFNAYCRNGLENPKKSGQFKGSKFFKRLMMVFL